MPIPALHGDLMTFQKTAAFQRIVHLAEHPFDTARVISSAQFRPTEKEQNVEQRDTTEHVND